MIFAFIVGALARLFLAWSGVGRSVAWQIEVSTATNSNLELREGIELYRFGVSPYIGSSCRTPPLALWLYTSLAQQDVFYVLPNVVLDILAALLLHEVALTLFSPKSGATTCSQGPRQESADGHGRRDSAGSSAVPGIVAWAYLLNPFSLAASAAGTTSPLLGLAVVLALYGAVLRRQGIAALGVALAAYMSLHAAVLLLPVSCLLAYGPEDVATPLALLVPCSGGSQPGTSRPADPPTEGSLPAPEADGGGGGSTAAAADGAPRAGQGADSSPRGEAAGSGPECVSTAPLPPRQAEPKDPGQPQKQQKSLSGGSPGELHVDKDQQQDAAAEVTSHRTGQSVAPAPEHPNPGNQPAPALPLLPWRSLAEAGAYVFGWLLVIALLSELYLAPLAPRTSGRHGARSGRQSGRDGVAGTPLCLAPLAEHLLLQPPWPPLLASVRDQIRKPEKAPPAATAAASASRGHAGVPLAARVLDATARLAEDVRQRVAAASAATSSCWAVRVYGSQVLLDDVTPNVGQWWYLSMEAFEDSQVYIRLLAHSLLVAMAPPLAMRLGPRRPLALFLLQLLSLTLLLPYPSVADLGLALSLLPLLARQQLAAMRMRLLLPASLALLCVLGPAMLRMWLNYESANSNFFYSVTLLYGVWQVVLMGQLLSLTLGIDRAVRGKEDGMGLGRDEGGLEGGGNVR